MDEIKETVVQVLDKQGVLATLKAQLRACVFAVVDGQIGKSYTTDLEHRANNPHKAKLTSTSEGVLLIALVRDFLAWTNMNYALKVYEAEANLNQDTLATDQLHHQLGLEHTVEEPLLLSILHRFLANGDPTMSPRIAAKGKTSIAAKPGGHTVNISAAAMQTPLRHSPDVIKATHYPTPASVPAAAAAAAAMHAGTQQQRSSQLQSISGAQIGSSSPHSMSPTSSCSLSPTGPATVSETPGDSLHQLAVASTASKASIPQETGASSSLGAVSILPVKHADHVGVPIIRQIAPESSAPSLQPSTSGTSILSEVEFEDEDNKEAESSLHASTSLTTAAVKAHTERQTASGITGSHAHDAEQHMQPAGLQSPGSSVSPSNLGLSLSVPAEANRKIFAEKEAMATPIKVAIPTEVNRKAFAETPGGLISPGDNSTVYEPDSLSASGKSSPNRILADNMSQQSSPVSRTISGQEATSTASAHSRSAGAALTPTRLVGGRLPPLAPLQASPTRRSAEQIRRELREQDNWFDETDDSADESVGSPVIAPQTWKVHQGLGAGDAHSSGITNAAFVDDESVSGHSLPQYTFDASVPDEF